MKRLLATATFVTLTCAISACGGETVVDLKTLFPADSAVPGWTQDTTLDTAAGPSVFSTNDQVNATDIDGDVVPFSNKGFTALGREHFKSDKYKMDVRVWQMKDAATAKLIYDDLPNTVDRYKIITWTNETIGLAGRSGNSGTMWRINAYKGLYFIETLLTTSEASDTAGKDEAIKMAKAVADKIK